MMRSRPPTSFVFIALAFVTAACPKEPPEPVPVKPEAPEPEPDDTKSMPVRPVNETPKLEVPIAEPAQPTPPAKPSAPEPVKAEPSTAPVTTANPTPPVKPATM